MPAIYVFESNMPLTQNSIDGGLINGDIIIDIKGSQALWSTLRASVNSISPGETLELTVIRDGKRKKLEIITKKRPNTPQAL